MAEWAKEVKGDPEALARRGDHSLQVNWESYLDVEAMRPIYEETIAAALAHAVRLADRRPPTVLDATAEAAVRADPGGVFADGGLATEAARTALKDQAQTWLAGYSGFEGSPFASASAGCSDPFWGCLECPNAVIHEGRLPAIVATLDRMVAARTTMSPEAWRARFGRPFLRIVDDVVPAFGPAAWERLRRAAAARNPGWLCRPGSSMRRTASDGSLASVLRSPALPVLAGLAEPVFGEDVWDLRAAGLPARSSAGDARLDFRTVEDPHWQLLAKEYFWARLNEPVEGSRVLPPQSARAEFSAFMTFCRWMLDPGAHPNRFRPTLSLLRHSDLDAFVQSFRDGGPTRPISNGTLGIYLRVVERLHDYSEILSHDRLAIHPRRHKHSSTVAGSCRSSENKTPRIPSEVLAPFVRWALFSVEMASRDILAGLAEADRLRARSDLLPSEETMAGRLEEWISARRDQGRGIPGRPWLGDHEGDRRVNDTAVADESGLPAGYIRRREVRERLGEAAAELGLDGERITAVRFEPVPWTTHAKSDVLARLADYIEARRRAGRGIPCWSELSADVDGNPNMMLIAAQLGMARMQEHHNPEAFAMVRSAVAEVGGEPGGMDTEISLDPDTGRPWRPRFGPNSVLAEASYLRAACYVVCAYLSGMRGGELMEIRPDALRLERSADGVVNRHRVASVVSKGRRAPEPSTWVVTEHVAAALEVMERLDGSDLVFGRLASRREAINHLRDHVNQLAPGEPGLCVPDLDGQPWRFDTRQFRRTLAWFIGSQPFGVWAGAVQFKHRSVRSAMEGIGPTVSEGYVGTTPSGFPSEVDLARRAAADLYVDNLTAAHAGGAASGGPGAARVNAQLDDLRREADDGMEAGAGPRAVDGTRRTAMLRSVSRNLFVGPLTDCFFDPDVALCLREHDRSTATAPIVGRCQPDRCRNSRIGEHHLPEWEDRLAQVRRDLRTRGLPPIQRQHLADQRDRLAAAIAGLRRAGKDDG